MHEVTRILNAIEAADAGGLAAGLGGPPAAGWGDRIRRYTLVEKLGKGGFGDV